MNAPPEPRPIRLLLVGAGGLGCAAGRVLARSVARMPRRLSVTVIDDDAVSPDNLHRQVFYGERDVGAPKAALYAERFASEARSRGGTVEVRSIHGRLVPENTLALFDVARRPFGGRPAAAGAPVTTFMPPLSVGSSQGCVPGASFALGTRPAEGIGSMRRRSAAPPQSPLQGDRRCRA